jgi:hypothetical protein
MRINPWISSLWRNIGEGQLRSLAVFPLAGTVIVIIALSLTWTQETSAQAQLCATPGKDGLGGTLTGVVNTYYPGGASVAAGATSITLGAATGASTQITSGDLLIVIQMQDASIDSSNTNRYGDGVNGGGNTLGVGSGYTSPNNVGKYEFAKANNTVTLTGGTLNLTGGGGGGGLINAYTNANSTAAQGQRRFQVVRVPQYATATFSSGLTARAWSLDATTGLGTGGVLSIDVAGTLTLNNATVSVSGLGFRGGAGRQLTGGGGGTNTDYRTPATSNYHGPKGEGIAGTPRYVYNAAAGVNVDLGSDGYPNGSQARGAPGNAGGGGTDGNPAANDQNSGGGGGGNGGAGGVGGNTWNSDLASRGGFGGVSFAERAPGVLVMGGGGGAGTRNNDDNILAASSGAAGGGIVILRVGLLSGSGSITSNGSDAFNDTLNDGGGGGGAGGSVMVWSLGGGLGGLTVNAHGGEGGDAWRIQAPNGTPGERHGPGGGGGGGVIFTSAALAASNVAGGGNGITTTANDNYGATGGTAGVATSVTSSQIPGTKSGAECVPPTEVAMGSFEATSFKQGVLIQWNTGYETNNLGFNLYREVDGKRTLVNQSLLAGSALTIGAGTKLTAGHSYYWVDTDVKPGQSVQYWIEDIDLNGAKDLHGPIGSVSSTGKLPEYGKAFMLSEIARNHRAQPQREVLNTADLFAEQKTTFALTAKPVGGSSDNLSAQWQVAATPGAKLSVKKDGWYRVSQLDLARVGLNTNRDPALLQLFVDGQEVPLQINGGAHGRLESTDSVEFYGTAYEALSTNVHTYYLFYGNKPGLRISKSPGETGLTSNLTSFPMTIELREKLLYFAALENGDAENWFGAVVTSAPVDQVLNVSNLSSAPVFGDQTAVEVALQGVTVDPVLHSVKVSLNGMAVGTVDFGGVNHQVSRIPVPPELLQSGQNVVTLQAQNGDMDVSLVDYVRLTYNHSYVADSNSLRFAAPGGEVVTVGGFAQNTVRVVDVTDPANPAEISAAVNADAGSFAATLASPGVGTRSLYAFTDDQIMRPDPISYNQPSTLNRPGAGVDMVVISHSSFLKSLAPLVSLRNQQKLSVALIDVEDIYDEFNYGARSAQAIKDFLTRASKNWKSAPRFVLLVGDASIDPKNYLGLGEWDLVPTKMIDSAFFETASDDWFADFSGDGLAQMSVGRLPVRTAEQADAVITKIVTAEQQKSGFTALLVADRNDGFDFEGTEQAVKSLLPAGSQITEVFRSRMADGSAHNQIIAALNQGPRVVNYNGHGSSMLWRGNLLTSADAPALTNATSPSFVVSMTCLNGLFEDASSDSLGEALIKAPNGGAFAVWASSGLREPLSQSVVNQELYRQLFNSGASTIGEAVRRAKSVVTDLDIRRTWILFGDPASRMR